MSVLSIEELTVSPGLLRQTRANVLSKISFSVQKGEIVGVVGPNGAGKTTLLNSIAGIQAIHSGRIQICGEKVGSLSALERAKRISYLPQHCDVPFPYKVKDVLKLAFYGDHSLSEDQQQQKVNYALETLEIDGLLNRNINELSGGEQQLVHLARTIAQNCTIMLLDEPTSSLDLSHESRLFTLLKQLKKRDYSTLLAIHDLNTAARLCDKIALISKGKLCGFGSPSSVFTVENLRRIYGNRVDVQIDSLGLLRIEAQIR
ncbi:ABC transporter ATP-binding protein [Vibrio ulleungensis]|uniref:ABC transporter ATP-binding protein n=1 Tax=Vibrio ulleungensis TaxID=2807619 RepID=A0ABS2HRA1_9VIBR|nr:ABC transporter ATP-binding protein [Vibrio ulleungensis]MBM7038416.1 ABC transporter ATP-binding protein [Vibrio ulleungensis]